MINGDWNHKPISCLLNWNNWHRRMLEVHACAANMCTCYVLMVNHHHYYLSINFPILCVSFRFCVLESIHRLSRILRMDKWCALFERSNILNTYIYINSFCPWTLCKTNATMIMTMAIDDIIDKIGYRLFVYRIPHSSFILNDERCTFHSTAFVFSATYISVHCTHHPITVTIFVFAKSALYPILCARTHTFIIIYHREHFERETTN